jgi:hypothetical protein
MISYVIYAVLAVLSLGNAAFNPNPPSPFLAWMSLALVNALAMAEAGRIMKEKLQ